MDGDSVGDGDTVEAGESPDPGGRASDSPDIPAGRTPDGAVTRDSVDDVEDGDTPFYEWIGMLAGGLGIFLTPLLTGPVVGYCYLKIRDEKPKTALLLLALVLGTAVFWAFASAVLIAPNL